MRGAKFARDRGRRYSDWLGQSPARAQPLNSRGDSFAGVGDAPDGFRAVVGNQQRAIGRDRHAYGAAPDVSAIYHKTGHEVFILAGRLAGLMERDANEFVANARGAIPGAVLGG